MSQKPETRFRKRVTSALDKLPRTYYFSVQQIARRGDPDIVLCINGSFVALELKASAQEMPTPLQRRKLEWILDAEGIAFVVYPENWDEILEYLQILACNPYPSEIKTNLN